MKKLDVVGLGALNMDKLFRVSRIVSGDEEGFVTGYSESCGGSAANTIVALARLKLKTGFIGKVALDREGRLLLEDLRKESVATQGVIQVEEGRSGSVIGFIDGEGERALYVDSGVNDMITMAEARTEYDCRFFHLSSFVGTKSFETQKKLVQALPRHVKVSFDPGMLYTERGVEELEPLLKRSDVMFPTQKELNILFGRSDYRKGANLLLRQGVKIVAVKLGSRGCYVTDGSQSLHIQAFRVKTVDTTGAGDAFDAGFLYGLLNNKNLHDCGRIGNYVASRCVTDVGARAALPSLSELQEAGLA